MTPKHGRPFQWAAMAWATLFVVAAPQAAQVVELLPIRDDILALRVSDGSIAHARGGQKLTDDKVFVSPLKTAALTAAGFILSSANDGAYATAKSASALNRKSKGIDFAFVEENWVDNFGYKPARPYAAVEHWIYLRFATALIEGRTYTLSWDKTALGLDTASASMTFDPSQVRSEAIHVNVVGYSPAAPQKFGYIYHWAGDLGGIDYAALAGKNFSLVDASTSQVVFTGTIAFRKAATNAETGNLNTTPSSNFLGAPVWECDFSAFTTPGRYKLVVPSLGCSFPFTVDVDAYRAAFQAAMKGIYINRSGIALAAPFTNVPRPAPHHVKLTPGFAGRLKYTTTRFYEATPDGGGTTDRLKYEAGAKGALTDTWGWYQDAGDWDGYFSHLNIPNVLLALYQLNPNKFFDHELSIPESGNGIPDVVDEAAWLPRFFARQRAELKAKGWGTGGVGSRVFGDYWGGDLEDNVIRGSWQDVNRDWYVTGEDPFSTYRYAAAAAQLAEILASLGRTDDDGVDWKREAIESFDWAAKNTKPAEQAMAQGDSSLPFHRALAAVSLYRLTGEAAYHAQIKADLASLSAASELDPIQALAATLYVTTPQQNTVDAALKTTLVGALTQHALFLTDYSASRRATRYGGHWYFPMVIGQPTTPMVHTAVLAYAAIKPSDAAAASTILAVGYTTADYFLGANPLNLVWIAGLGPRSLTQVFALDDFASGRGARTGRMVYGGPTFGDAGIPLRMAYSPWWAWDATYPSIDARGAGQPSSGAVKPGTWPGHEAYFALRASPQTSEFTIWQNNLVAAVSYGFLCAEAIGTGPIIATQPAGFTSAEGASGQLSVAAAGADVTYQWYHDGAAIEGATSATLSFPLLQRHQGGNYTVSVRKGAASTLSDAVRVTVTPGAGRGRLVNLSSRGYSKPNDGVLIAGVRIAGEGEREILARVVGPGLEAYNVADFLRQPRLELVQLLATGNQRVGLNTDWTAGGVEALTAKFDAVGAFRLDPTKSDTALVATLPPGGYTALAQLGDGRAGNALIELYDLGGSVAGAELTNLSVRGFCGTGDNVLIAGVVIASADSVRLLLRGMGPSLANYGVTGVLMDPVLELHQARNGTDTLLLRSDDWRRGGNAAEIPVVSEQLGAFSSVPDDREAVMLLSLRAGVYTVVMRGAGNTEGNGLIELYRVQ